jgi:hypothetical protein
MKRKQMRGVGLMAIGLMLFFVSNISYILLAFAYRDFSFALMVMYLGTAPSLVLSWYLIDASTKEKKTKRKPMAISTKIATVLEEVSNE